MRHHLTFRQDPYAYFQRCLGQRGLFFLDSSQKNLEASHSYLGFTPVDRITGTDFVALRRWLKTHSRKNAGGLSDGGAVGYITYDGKYCFGIYENIITFDLFRRRILINARTSKALKQIADLLQAPLPVQAIPTARIKTRHLSGAAQYQGMVKEALRHIKAGDIYQINLARAIRLTTTAALKPADAAAVYAALRRHSPSPFSAYYQSNKNIILSSSPERFLKLSGRSAEIRPMKGTRSRGNTPAADRQLKEDLLKSPKEIAELLMVTDLERNDLGRVAQIGSVKVTNMRRIESYTQVYQATATIQAKLRTGCDGIDLIQAAFPSGSVTGCPKIEAMKIINRLEDHPRGLYTGALGYIAFNGDMDFSVLIRSLFLNPKGIDFYVGSGIVADSDPAAEYHETVIKARAMEQALKEVLGA